MKLAFSISVLATALRTTNADQQQLRGRALAEALPEAEQVTFGFNVLKGKPPSERGFEGEKLFSLSGDRGTVNGFTQYQEFKELTTTERCTFNGVSRDVFFTSSRSMLESQASSSSHGAEREVDIGVSVPLGNGVEASASETIKNALVFGNSKSSTTATGAQNSGRTFSFDASARRLFYAVELDYANIDTWTPGFLSDCASLGNSPSTYEVLLFFKKYGTHGLATAGFGQKCLSSIFMESGETLSTYYDFRSEESSFQGNLLWWQSTSQQSQSSENFQSDQFGFQYEVSNRRCEGVMVADSPCGGGMSGSGINNAPAIVEWTYKPMWDFSVPGLETGAKEKMRSVFEEVMEASVRCMETSCNGNGACAPLEDAWDTIGESTSLDALFDTNKCFCVDDFTGDKCDIGRSLRVENPDQQRNYENEFDEAFNFSNGDPICGIESIHSNSHEDRRFKFSTCAIDEPDTDFELVAGSQTTLSSPYDKFFTLSCDKDKVLTGILSIHHNGFEDRRFTATCTHFKETKVDDNTCDDFPGGYENNFDQRLAFTCPRGKVLTGIQSVHHNGFEDRRFRFRCCGLQVEKGAETNRLVKPRNFGPYVNEYDGPLDQAAVVAGKAATFCGFSSVHHNGREDRRFRFKLCRPGLNAKFGRTTVSDATNSNQLDGVSKIECPANSVITRIRSSHSNKHEDRTWSYRCQEIKDWETDMCQWTDFVNDFDKSFHFECGDQHVIAGIQSIHDNHHEDRRFKFQCCRMREKN